MIKETLVAVQRDYFGEIISFQTSEGRIISYQKAMQEAENGTIAGVDIIENQDGSSILNPVSNNGFDDFPSIY